MLSLASYPTALAIGTFTLGALHAFEPGHGKAALAAYFVGSKVRLREALVASLATAVAHSLSIFGLALVVQLGVQTATRSSDLSSLHEIFDHLTHGIGLAVMVYGLWIAFRTLRSSRQRPFAQSPDALSFQSLGEHSHAHSCSSCETHSLAPSQSQLVEASGSQEMPSGTAANPMRKGSWRKGAIFGFGIGLIPCPTALAAYFSTLSSQGAQSATWIVIVFGLGIFSSFAGLAIILAISQTRHLNLGNRLQLSARSSDLMQSALLVGIGAYTLFKHTH